MNQCYSERLNTIDVLYSNWIINFTKTYKYFGTVADHHLNFKENFGKSCKIAKSRLWLLERMRCYFTSKVTRLVYTTMIISLITSSFTLKSPYNNNWKLKYNLLDRIARKIRKFNVPSIESVQIVNLSS